MSEAAAPAPGISKKFGTFTGVFTPTLLTILGVIMFVRLGWVVGNGGLIGAWLLMLLAMGITAATGLSLSSIATNTRLGAGGPYAIISNSLGLEVGGSIGIPLYLSRPLGVAMYIFGFREGWLWFFPDHNALLVDTCVFVALFGLAYISANLAFKIQYAIMAIIVLAIFSIVASPYLWDPVADTTWFGDYRGFPENGFEGTGFWVVFGIFFPATTGILAGANMSGDLKNPRRSIPRGTLWAIGLSTIIYFGLAYAASRMGTVEELTSNYNVLIDKALFPWAVLAGLLGATFSSALASAVGGPRILMAMGQHDILPQSPWLSKTHRGEPRNAIAITAVLSFACLMMRDLNAIAPLVTMFFLITYFFINLVLLIENSLGLVSFRPTLRVPQVVPLFGAVGCVFVMFIMNPTFSLLSVGFVVGIYVYLLKRGVPDDGDVQDVRSGIFGAVAEWAANRVSEHGSFNVRAWKPNLMVPVEDPDEIRGEFSILLDVCRPEGAVKLLGVATNTRPEVLRPRVDGLVSAFMDKKVFATSSIVDSDSFIAGVIHGLQALQSAFFRPNILFLRLPDNAERFEEFGDVMVQAHQTGVGVMMLAMHHKAGFGQSNAINLWLRPAPDSWDVREAFEVNNLDLTLLMGYRLSRRWKVPLTLVTVVADEQDKERADAFLKEICDLARIPSKAVRHVMVGSFTECSARAPMADINIFGLQEDPDFDFMCRMVEVTHSSCLYVADSGRESALA